MHDTSAQLVEWVLPAASYRQSVTVPFPLRLRIARDPGDLSRALNLFHRALPLPDRAPAWPNTSSSRDQFTASRTASDRAASRGAPARGFPWESRAKRSSFAWLPQVAEDHLMASMGEDRSELGAHQP